MDQGGQQLDGVYEPGTPMGEDDEAEIAGADVEGEAQLDPVQGRDVPEFQQLGPALEEKIVVSQEDHGFQFNRQATSSSQVPQSFIFRIQTEDLPEDP